LLIIKIIIMKNLKLTLVITFVMFLAQACGKANGFGPSNSVLTGRYANLSSDVERAKEITNALYTRCGSGTTDWIKVDMDLNGAVDLNSLDGEYDKNYTLVTMEMSDRTIQQVVFPRSYLFQLSHDPYTVFTIVRSNDPNRPFSPGVYYKATL
jgi:hypothetical protein